LHQFKFNLNKERIVGRHIQQIGKLVSLLAFLCFSIPLWGQSLQKASVAGKVISSSGETLVGVAVVLKDTRIGTTTDLNGRFEIKNIPAGSYVLQARYLGFETLEKSFTLKAAQQLKIELTLQEAALMMEAAEATAKSMSREVSEQAFAVTAIPLKDLYNSTADAKQVLSRVSGVRIAEEGGLGSDLNFSLNGFSGDQVKFFLDGIPMDNFGSSLSISNIPVNTIDRIEIYKGVVPVWLGTDALGGAVNIISNQKFNYLDASYSVGSFNTHRLSLNGAYTNLNTGFTFRGNVSYNHSDNNYKVWVPKPEDNDIADDSVEVERFHDRYRSDLLKLESGWVNRKFADNLLFGIMLAGNDKQVQTGATMKSVYGGILQNSRSVSPTLKYRKEDLFTEGLDISLYSSYNKSEGEVIDTLRGVTYNWLGEASYTEGSNNGENLRTFTTLNDEEFNSQFNAGYQISSQHSLALNYSLTHFRREVFDSENPDKIENKFPNSLGKQVLGLAYKFDPSKKWSSTLFGKFFFLNAQTSKEFDFGLKEQRTEAYEVNKQNAGYGLATTYFLLPELQLKASYEHTYRMPWASEIFGNGLFIQANPDLGPEQSDNLNLGASYRFKLTRDHEFALESSLIYREAKDLIYQVVKVASPLTYYDNLSQTRTLGVEGNIQYQWKERLRLGANFTYQNITDQADSVYNESYTNPGYQKNFQKGYRLPNTPYLFANANAGLTFNNVLMKGSALNLNYFFNFVENYFLSWAELGSIGKKVIPRPAAHNLELSYSLKNGKYNISAECRNLTDARLYDKYFLQKPGRAFYLKLRYVL
jgi:outer membrane receptor protein involved in Fe transport